MLRKPPTMLIIYVAAVVAATIYGVCWLLGWYICPESPTDRKDHGQVMVVGLGAIGATITAIIGWRNLKQSQRSTETTIENTRLRSTETTIENTRLIEEDRAQNDALQKYLEQMGQLLTEVELRQSEKGSDARVLAPSQTLTVLQGLSADRKRILLRFLYESHLIDRGDDTIVDLAGADLRGANVSLAYLHEADLREANLRGAKVSQKQLEACGSLNGAIMPNGSKHY